MKQRVNNKVLLRKMAQEKGIRPSSFAVFSLLIDMASYKDYTCFPSVKYIAKKINISTRTIFRALNELESLGFIKRIARFESERNNRQTSNIYTLIIPKEEIEEIKEETKNNTFVYDKNKTINNDNMPYEEENDDKESEEILTKDEKDKYMNFVQNELKNDLKPNERMVIKRIYKDDLGNTKIDFYIRKLNILERLIEKLKNVFKKQ